MYNLNCPYDVESVCRKLHMFSPDSKIMVKIALKVEFEFGNLVKFISGLHKCLEIFAKSIKKNRNKYNIVYLIQFFSPKNTSKKIIEKCRKASKNLLEIWEKNHSKSPKIG